MTQKDAQMIILNLVQVAAPNLRELPAWNIPSVTHLFNTLSCPYQIRPDAITAVGAPSSISYLVKAIYWLYQAVSVLCNPISTISEESQSNYSVI